MNIAMHFGEEYEDDFDIGGHDDHSVQEKYKLVGCILNSCATKHSSRTQ